MSAKGGISCGVAQGARRGLAAVSVAVMRRPSEGLDSKIDAGNRTATWFGSSIVGLCHFELIGQD